MFGILFRFYFRLKATTFNRRTFAAVFPSESTLCGEKFQFQVRARSHEGAPGFLFSRDLGSSLLLDKSSRFQKVYLMGHLWSDSYQQLELRETFNSSFTPGIHPYRTRTTTHAPRPHQSTLFILPSTKHDFHHYFVSSESPWIFTPDTLALGRLFKFFLTLCN